LFLLRSMFKAFVLSLVVAVCWSAPQQSSSTTVTPVLVQNHVYFVVSAKGINGVASDNDGVADPFVKVFLGTEPLDGNQTESALEPLEISETIEHDNNPTWNKVFKVRHVQGTKQLLYLEVRDHDPINPDDVIGDAYIKLDDFVSQGKYTKVLEKAKSGSITVTRTTPIYFDLTLKDVPAKDQFDGASDPYVKCYFRVGQDGKDFKFHSTETVDNAQVASWEHIAFENYQRGANQILHFRVKDEDTITGDDDLGEAFLEVDGFINGKKDAKFTLLENATLTVSLNRNL